MNYVDSLVHHSFHRWEDLWDVEPSGKSTRASAYNVRDSDDSCIWYSLDRAGVKLAYVAGANQSDAETCIWKHSGFPSNLLGIAIELLHLSECWDRTLTAGELNYEAGVSGPRMALEDGFFCLRTDLIPKR
jgi:hypothetical protein